MRGMEPSTRSGYRGTQSLIFVGCDHSISCLLRLVKRVVEFSRLCRVIVEVARFQVPMVDPQTWTSQTGMFVSKRTYQGRRVTKLGFINIGAEGLFCFLHVLEVLGVQFPWVLTSSVVCSVDSAVGSWLARSLKSSEVRGPWIRGKVQAHSRE